MTKEVELSTRELDFRMANALLARLATGAVLAFLAFSVAPVAAGLASGALGHGVMRVMFVGLVAGLLRRRDDPLWHPPAVAVIGSLVGAIVLASVYPHLDMGHLVLQGFLSAGVAILVALVVQVGLSKLMVVGGLLFISGAFLWQAGVLPGAPRQIIAAMPHSLTADPQPEQYAFDGGIYARTVTLMKQGIPYYAAFAQAFDEDARNSGPPPGGLNYRQRWLSEIWTLVPGSGHLAPWRTLAVFALVVMACGYAFARRYVEPSAALLVPMWLAAYYSYPMLSFRSTFAEFYGAGFAIVMLWLVSRQKWLAGAIVLTLAVAARELMLVLVPVYLLAWTLNARRRDELPALVVAAVAPILVLAYHLLAVPTAAVSGGAVETWLQGAGLGRTYDALRFSTEAFPFADVLIFLWLGTAAVAGFAIRGSWRKALVLGTIAAPLVLLTMFSSGQYDYYWGGIATPIIIAIAPVAAAIILPSTCLSADSRGTRKSSLPGFVRIVLPAYNESAAIGDLLDRIDAAMKSADQPYAVLVVDDGSTDQTGDIARAYATSRPVVVVRNDSNRGLGGAILRGLKAASRASNPGDMIVTLDADLTQDPAYIPRLIERWSEGADIVIASRFRHGARVVGLSGFRRLMTYGARVGMSVVMPIEGVRDYSCGFRLYDATALQTAFELYGDRLVTERGFACMVEILGKMRTFSRVEEVPFVLRYDEKRSASSMRVGPTVAAYFAVASRVVVGEFAGRRA